MKRTEMLLSKFLLSDGVNPTTVKVRVPDKLEATAFFGSDKSDPLNMRRVLALKIGDLGFRIEEDTADDPHRVCERFVKAALILGMEYAAEIRDALKAE